MLTSLTGIREVPKLHQVDVVRWETTVRRAVLAALAVAIALAAACSGDSGEDADRVPGGERERPGPGASAPQPSDANGQSGDLGTPPVQTDRGVAPPVGPPNALVPSVPGVIADTASLTCPIDAPQVGGGAVQPAPSISTAAVANETLLIIDGRSNDWAGRPAFAPDPLGDGESGVPDFGNTSAFINDDALYILVETVGSGGLFDSFELELEADGRRLFVGWGPGSDNPWVADITTEWVDLGPATLSSAAFVDAFEMRLDLRDLLSPKTLSIAELRIMAGECCEAPAWRASDRWRPSAAVPTVAESDPAWRVALPGSAREADFMLAAPDTRAITPDFDVSAERVRVTGTAGAVPPASVVLVGNLELNDFVTLRADVEGAFETEVAAAPGTHVMIKQDTTGRVIRPAAERHRFNEDMIAPGVLLRVPGTTSASGIAVSGGGRICCDDMTGWSITGTLERNALAAGEEARVSGRITLWGDLQGRPPRQWVDFTANLLGDELGRQVGRAGKFVTPFLTATGLPIEPTLGGVQLGGTELDWRFVYGRWVGDFELTLRTSAGMRTGFYALSAGGLWGLGDAGIQPLDGMRPFDVVTRDDQARRAVLGTLKVGDPAPMRLATLLLADELSEGSRGGVLAVEDRGLFDVAVRTVTRHDSVVPRLYVYGESWTYRLEPYAPMLDVVDRALPNPPALELDLAKSGLTVQVVRPDGQVDVLGPAPLARYAVRSPRTLWGTALGLGGGELREIPQLQGNGDTFAYRFPTDGDYLIRLDGSIADTDGNGHGICGTYDLTVGNLLDIEAGLLPGTPFEVGDAIAPVVTTMPGVPADVTYTVTLAGAGGEFTAETFTGRANAYGWWDGGGATFTFARDGEYRVDIDARHTDADGNLWVGRLRFGSAVATPDAPIIAHGRRGPDNQREIAPPWAFETAFVMEESDHMQFPYFTGDVLWGMEETDAGDAVVTHSSVQLLDEGNPLVARAVQLARRFKEFDEPSIAALIRAGQMPLITAAESPGEGHQSVGAHPDEIGLWAYMYSGAQRPGVRVREVIQGDDVPGSYWRFGDAYNGQSGNGPQGDLPDDYKFLYGAAVIRDPVAGEGIYAIYGSAWVHAVDDDPLGARFFPPFQGAAGGPDVGPLFTIHGRDIDLFFLPMGVRPGAVLETGDTFRMAGPIMPTLASRVEYTITAPDGSVRSFDGRANTIGYFYDPADDFTLDQAGLWTVTMRVIHDGMTSAGPVQEPFPTGGVLTPDGATFNFVVAGPGTTRLTVASDLDGLAPDRWFEWGLVRSARFLAALPEGWSRDEARVVVTMPGTVLVDEMLRVENNTVVWNLDAYALNALADNFDVDSGIVDTVTVTFFAEGMLAGAPAQAVGTVVAHGARLPRVPGTP